MAVISFSKNYYINLTFWWFLRLNSVELKPLLNWIAMWVKDQRTWIRIKEMQENSPNKKAQHLGATVRLSPELSLMGFSILSVMMVSHGASKLRAIFCSSCCDQIVLRWNVVMRQIYKIFYLLVSDARKKTIFLCLVKHREPSSNQGWKKMCWWFSHVPFIVSLLDTTFVTGIKWDCVCTDCFQYIKYHFVIYVDLLPTVMFSSLIAQ